MTDWNSPQDAVINATRIAARYIRFADDEARSRSPLYEALARGVAADQAVLGFLASLPLEKQQPNLLLGTVRHLFGTPSGWAGFRKSLLANFGAVRAFMLAHSTQTNEPARCATLLPVLAALPQPLALIEVGAAAGLCLLPDHYGYDYGRVSLFPSTPATEFPIFRCSASPSTPLPDAMPKVVWRAGLDLNPLSVADPAQAAWLESLVWPEQSGRLEHLRSAMQVARATKPRVLRGRLQGNDLTRLCHAAPRHATLVVFHTAVLAYVAGRSARQAFAEQVMTLCPYWISNEAPRVFPDIAAQTKSVGGAGRFLLSVNGRPVAWTESHGASIDWIAGNEDRGVP